MHLVIHKLKIKEGTKPVKHAPRHFLPKLEVKVKHDVQKLFDVGFVEPIQH